MNDLNLSTLIPMVLIAIVALCVLVSVIVQITKNTKFLDKIPTELEVLVLSIIFAVIGVICYMQYLNVEVTFLIVVASIILGIFVAYITMFGWESLVSIITKFKVPSEFRDVCKLTATEKDKILNTINSSNEKSDTNSEKKLE